MSLRNRAIRFILAVMISTAFLLQGAAPAATVIVQAAVGKQTPTVTVSKKTLYIGYQNYKIKFKELSDTAVVTYQSSNEKIITVQNGIIKPVKKGKATITVTINQDSKKYTSTIVVTVKNPSISIEDNTDKISAGLTLVFKGAAHGISNPDLIWSSSNTSVATIDEKSGKFQAVSAGTITITLKDKTTGIQSEVKVIVTKPNEELVVTPTVSAYVPPEGSDKAVYLSGLDLSTKTGTYYTTTKEEFIETTRFVLFLNDGVEVPVNVIELINNIMDAIEKETGYQFYTDYVKKGYYSGMEEELSAYFDTAKELLKINPTHERVEIVVTKHDKEVEAYASGVDGILLSPDMIKLVDGGGHAVIHELLHIVHFRNGCPLGQVLQEGFTTYYTDVIIGKNSKIKWEHNSHEQLYNFQGIVNEDTMESLFINCTSGDASYKLGFRMMHFIIENYGKEALRRSHDKLSETYSNNNEPTMEAVAESLKSELSQDIFVKFARWMITKRALFGDIDMSSKGDWLIENGRLSKYYGNAVNVIIPETATEIQPSAFAGCQSIETISIPSTVTAIYGGAFDNCKKLISIVIPDTVTVLRDYVFIDCIKLKKVTLSKNLQYIDVGLFNGCTSLTEVTIPEKVTEIKSNALGSCKALKTVNLPDGLVKMGNCVFYECSSLKSVAIPDTVIEIGTGMFMDCISLESVKLPAGINEIPKNMFFKCSSLTNFVIPEGVTSIGYSAFLFSGLTTVKLPETLKSIDELAFAQCKNMKQIEIPKSVTYIHPDAFEYLDNLIIYGKSGSYAEKYAKENGFTFKKVR